MNAPFDARAAAQAGQAALAAGNPAAARVQFESIIKAGLADQSVWISLGVACQRQGDLRAMTEAADRALVMNNKNLRALALKADACALAGDLRNANSYYRAVLSLAAMIGQLPPDFAQVVRYAQTQEARINQRLAEHIEQRLAAAGYDRARSSARFTHSLDLLFGRKQPYHQQPRAYLFPELAHIQFFAREAIPWLAEIEAAAPAIRAELDAAIGADAAFAPYIQGSSERASIEAHSLLNSLDWSALFLCKEGAPTAHAANFPQTLRALDAVPLCRIPGRAPSILFSQLRPGAHIRPHTGFINARMICHLPLIVPDGCWFRVGNETRSWREGEAWAFDDTIEHEAKNDSSRTRIILIFDVWRPELSEDERALVGALIEAADSLGPAEAWSA